MSQTGYRLAASNFVILIKPCGTHVSFNGSTTNLINNEKDRNYDHDDGDTDNDDDNDNDDNAKGALSCNSLHEG